MWWTYGLTGEECRKIFPQLTSEVLNYNKITYVRKNERGVYSFRFTEDSEESEREYFKDKLIVLDAEEKHINGLVGVI